MVVVVEGSWLVLGDRCLARSLFIPLSLSFLLSLVVGCWILVIVVEQLLSMVHCWFLVILVSLFC